MIDDTITSFPHPDAYPLCHVCGDQNLELFENYSRFHRVTSDCKPWRRGGTLALCHSCCCVQKLTDTAWQAETDAIYDAYSIYYQSAGTEQVVFDQRSGTSTSRSLKILNCVSKIMQLPETGKHLDIGCGNGALLNQFHENFPEWTLYGIELNEKYKNLVEAIPRVQKMYVNSNPDVIQDTFDCITIIHVLEHILHPMEYLEKIYALLKHEGILIIEVPFFVKNPYDLLIADHCTHFGKSTLCTLLQKSGFEVIFSSTTCVQKELTLVARKRNSQISEPISLDNQKASDTVVRCICWLDSNIRDSIAHAKNGHFGIFGTSIAATWLFSEIPDIVHFFVDEDHDRIGIIHLGRPVYDPNHVPEDSIVFLPFCPNQANVIRTRLTMKKKNLNCIISSISLLYFER